VSSLIKGVKFVGPSGGAVLIVIAAVMLGKLDAQEHRLGATFDLDANEASPGVATLSRRDNANLPERVDLSIYCPLPGNQGKYGTCTSWATAYHARTMLEAVRLKRKGRSVNVREAFSPSFVYNQIRKSHGCQNGTSILRAMELMKRKGSLKASVIKFNCSYSDWQKYEGICEPYKIKDYLKLHSPMANNKVLPVKRALANRQPVVIGMHIVPSFQKIRSDGMFRPTTAERKLVFTNEFFKAAKYNGHAMAVVGYDDSKGTAGAFRIINSWGSGWGNNGFCWVEYKDFNRYMAQSYSMIDFPVYSKSMKGMFVMETRQGKLMLGRYDAGRKAYHLAGNHAKGTQFRIYLKNDGPTYLYAFGFDSTGKTFKLFPHEKGVSAYIPYNKAHVPIPDDDHYIEIDDAPGRNDLCVLYSMKELPVDQLLAAIEKQGEKILAEKMPLRAVVAQELKKLGHVIVPEKQTVYSPGAFQFSSQRQSESCVPLILEFGH
jgi:hypothetical protein